MQPIGPQLLSKSFEKNGGTKGSYQIIWDGEDLHTKMYK